MQRGERVAAVDKIEEQRKPEDFIGHRNRDAATPHRGVAFSFSNPVLQTEKDQHPKVLVFFWNNLFRKNNVPDITVCLGFGNYFIASSNIAAVTVVADTGIKVDKCTAKNVNYTFTAFI